MSIFPSRTEGLALSHITTVSTHSEFSQPLICSVVFSWTWPLLNPKVGREELLQSLGPLTPISLIIPTTAMELHVVEVALQLPPILTKCSTSNHRGRHYSMANSKLTTQQHTVSSTMDPQATLLKVTTRDIMLGMASSSSSNSSHLHHHPHQQDMAAATHAEQHTAHAAIVDTIRLDQYIHTMCWHTCTNFV